MFRSPASGPVAAWILAMLAGLFFFAVIMRRNRDDELVEEGAESAGGAAFATRRRAAEVAPDEEHVPRWRRPSVQAARGSRSVLASRQPLRFATPPPAGAERVAVHYRFVRVADAPDDVRSIELGRLDRGDEVDVLDRQTGFALVRAPDGLEGWVPRMTLGQREIASE